MGSLHQSCGLVGQYLELSLEQLMSRRARITRRYSVTLVRKWKCDSKIFGVIPRTLAVELRKDVGDQERKKFNFSA